jgi:hypothetical protein
MKNNKKWSPTDPTHFEGKTVKQLQQDLIKANEFVKKHPKFEFGWPNEYRQELKKRIANTIGKK